MDFSGITDHKFNIIEVLLLAIMTAAGICFILAGCAGIYYQIKKYFKGRAERKAARRKPVNTFKQDPDVAEFKDAVKGVGVVLLVVISICLLSHGL